MREYAGGNTIKKQREYQCPGSNEGECAGAGGNPRRKSGGQNLGTSQPSKAVHELKRLACGPLSLRLCLGDSGLQNGKVWAQSSPASRPRAERSLIRDNSDLISALLWCPGERAKDQEGLLQGLQEAHDDEGHPVQDREGLSLRPGCVWRLGPDGGNRGASCRKRCANSHGSALCPWDVDLISIRRRITVSV